MVGFLQAWLQDQEPDTIAAFVEKYGEDRVRSFLAGCWAAFDLAEIIGEQVTDNQLTEDEADVMWAEFENDLEEGLELFGLKRSTPIC